MRTNIRVYLERRLLMSLPIPAIPAVRARAVRIVNGKPVVYIPERINPPLPRSRPAKPSPEPPPSAPTAPSLDAKQLFQAVSEANRAIAIIELEQQSLRQTLYGVQGGAGGEHVQTSATSSPVESAVLRLDAVAQRLRSEKALYAQKVELAERIIGQIEKPWYREVLRLRYLCRMKWEDVAAQMHYTEISSVYKCHRRALLAAQEAADRLT